MKSTKSRLRLLHARAAARRLCSTPPHVAPQQPSSVPWRDARVRQDVQHAGALDLQHRRHMQPVVVPLT